jgi:hypothetical protein
MRGSCGCVCGPAYADREHRDFSSAKWAHPESEFVVADGPDPGRWIGPADAAAAWGTASRSPTICGPLSIAKLDDERVLILSNNTGLGGCADRADTDARDAAFSRSTTKE